jgi:Domain of unknown function (DUF5916)/Carbohydrate family 9 binding domain-like
VKRIVHLLVLLTLASTLAAQDLDVAHYQDKYQLHIKRATGAIKVDGVTDENDWARAEVATDFWLKFPRDDEKARHQTEIRVTYDNQFLYLGAKIYDSIPLIAQSLKRDSRIRESDGIGLMLDPMNKKTNGFYFTVTSYNVQADDLLSVGGGGELSFSWDNKWYSATKIYTDYYTVEMAIPFKTLRYDKNNLRWGINFIRSDKKSNEFHTWTRVPVNFPSVDIGYFGALIWDEPPPAPGSNIAVIPYITGGVSENREANTGIETTANAGFDAKIAVSSSLNLDLTVNPDFSQVEVDQQVTNLSRFSIFFPERRNFFLENSDLFAEYGIPPIRPFYSRRIGLDPNARTIPILGGVRLTGNVTERTRIGIMSMQTKSTADYAAQNYSAVTVMQQVLSRSVIKAYFLNRQGFEDSRHKFDDPLDKYGRNAGLEMAFTSSSGKWQAWYGYHHSFKEGIKKDRAYVDVGGGYFGRQFTSLFDFGNTGVNYYADMGFVARIVNYDAKNDTLIRLGFKQMFNETSFQLNPKKGKIVQQKLSMENFLVLNPDNSFNEWNLDLNYEMQFKNTSSLELGFSHQQTQLLYHTGFTDKDPIPPGFYAYNNVGIEYRSDTRKAFSFAAEVVTGRFFTGTNREINAGVIYRNQPWFSLELRAQYNKLKFPEPYGNADLFLISSRVEINFSTKVFWTTFIQYYTQGNNFNINSRLQWRYKPVSDLFVVYTDNYFVDPLFKNKNRALVFKLNYWLNL